MSRTAWRDGDRTRVVDLAPLGEGRWRARVDDVDLEFAIDPLGPGRFRLTSERGTTLVEITAAGERRFVRYGALDFTLDATRATARRGRASQGGGLEAPMPGVVTRVLVGAGDAVQRGQPILALEAMKMEHVIRAPRDGRVRAIAAKVGDMVNGGVTLVEMDEAEAS